MAHGIKAKEKIMNLKKTTVVIFLAGCVFCSIKCTGLFQTSGNSSQTPNAVVGMLYEPDGRTPAKAVWIFMRPRNSLAGISGIESSMGPADTASVLTDDAGRFAFDPSLNAGLYVLEASGGGNAVFMDSIAIVRNNGTVTLPPDTLKPVGAIRGTVKLSAGGDPCEIYVLAFGIDRFTSIKADGSFLFPALAQGTYDLRLISSLANYGALDRKGVEVTASDTTDAGMLEPPYAGIPVPQNITLSYDTMRQIVRIHWSRLDTSTVKSYNIYRNDIDADFIAEKPLNKKVLADTSYNDTIISSLEGETFGYQVAAVDSRETQGPKSAEARTTAIGAYIKTESKVSMGSSDDNTCFTIDDRNNLWVADRDRNKILKFSPAGDLVEQWDAPFKDTVESQWLFVLTLSPGAIATDAHKNMFCLSSQRRAILKFDSSGNLVKSVGDTGDLAFLDISVDENGYIFSNTTHLFGDHTLQINKYDPNLTPVKSWSTRLTSGVGKSGLLARRGKVYCAGSAPSTDGVIDVFDTAGALIRSIQAVADEIAMDKAGLLYCLDMNRGYIRVIDETAGYIGKINPTFLFSFRNLRGLEVMDNGTVVYEDYRPVSDSAFSYLVFFRKR
jgi:hypothetical protein